jgi:hypothetical protein
LDDAHKAYKAQHAVIVKGKRPDFTHKPNEQVWRRMLAKAKTFQKEHKAYGEDTVANTFVYAKKVLESMGRTGKFGCSSVYVERNANQDKKRKEDVTGQDRELPFLEYDFTLMMEEAARILGGPLEKEEGRIGGKVLWAMSVVSGRRTNELLEERFKYGDGFKDDTLIINFLGKKKSTHREIFEFKVTCDRELFKQGLEYLRRFPESCDLSKQANIYVEQTWKEFNALVRSRYKKDYTVRVNRHVYAAYLMGDCLFVLEKVMDLLGHYSLDSSKFYHDMKHVPTPVADPTPVAEPAPVADPGEAGGAQIPEGNAHIPEGDAESEVSDTETLPQSDDDEEEPLPKRPKKSAAMCLRSVIDMCEDMGWDDDQMKSMVGHALKIL